LWREVLREYELGEHERVLLQEAARTADVCDALQAQLDEDGVLLSWGAGWRNHPVIAELRQQRVVLARLLVALRVPADEPQDQRQQTPDRFQQRGGPRGFYSMAPQKLNGDRSPDDAAS
jgi:hypothetical protein